MTDVQFYSAIGLPILFNTIGFTAIFVMFNWLNGRMSRLEDKFDTIMSKIVEMDNRVVRIEERLNIKP